MAKVSVIFATALVLGTTALPVSAISTEGQASQSNPGIALTGDDSGQLVADSWRWRRHRVRRRRFCRRSWSRRRCAFEKFYARRCQYRYSRRKCKRIFRRRIARARFDDYDSRYDIYDDRNDSRFDLIGEYILRRIFD